MPFVVDENHEYIVHQDSLASYLALFPDYYVVTLRCFGRSYGFRLQKKCPWN
jgi:hypothetical protein